WAARAGKRPRAANRALTITERRMNSTASRRPSIGRLGSHGLATRAAYEGSGQGDGELSSHRRDRVFDVSLGSDRRRLGVWDAWIGETFRAAGGQRGESPLVRG